MLIHICSRNDPNVTAKVYLQCAFQCCCVTVSSFSAPHCVAAPSSHCSCYGLSSSLAPAAARLVFSASPETTPLTCCSTPPLHLSHQTQHEKWLNSESVSLEID